MGGPDREDSTSDLGDSGQPSGSGRGGLRLLRRRYILVGLGCVLALLLVTALLGVIAYRFCVRPAGPSPYRLDKAVPFPAQTFLVLDRETGKPIPDAVITEYWVYEQWGGIGDSPGVVQTWTAYNVGPSGRLSLPARTEWITSDDTTGDVGYGVFAAGYAEAGFNGQAGSQPTNTVFRLRPLKTPEEFKEYPSGPALGGLPIHEQWATLFLQRYPHHPLGARVLYRAYRLLAEYREGQSPQATLAQIRRTLRVLRRLIREYPGTPEAKEAAPFLPFELRRLHEFEAETEERSGRDEPLR